jgi:hypothetical protein
MLMSRSCRCRWVLGSDDHVENQRVEGIGWNTVPPSTTTASCLYGEKQPLVWCLKDMHHGGD